MYIFFADDSTQNRPSRPGMGSLLSAGGFLLPADRLRDLERALRTLCTEFEFPTREEFKWSPPRQSWMRTGLIDDDRTDFFVRVLESLEAHDAGVIVVVADTRRTPRRTTSEEFVTTILLERIEMHVSNDNSTCLVIFDRPGGARVEENKFLARLLQMAEDGTDYVRMNSLAINPLSTESQYVRCLQAADLVISCSTAVIAGQRTHVDGPWAVIRRMFIKDARGAVGGTGCKIYGDRCEYHNLYHWLCGDDQQGGRFGLPWRTWHYFRGPFTREP